MEYTGSSYTGDYKNERLVFNAYYVSYYFILLINKVDFVKLRLEGKGEYSFPPSLETKYEGDMKDGM